MISRPVVKETAAPTPRDKASQGQYYFKRYHINVTSFLWQPGVLGYHWSLRLSFQSTPLTFLNVTHWSFLPSGKTNSINWLGPWCLRASVLQNFPQLVWALGEESEMRWCLQLGLKILRPSMSCSMLSEYGTRTCKWTKRKRPDVRQPTHRWTSKMPSDR